MAVPDTDFPRTHWELFSAESYVLLEGPSADARRALKLAMLELVARRRLVLVNVEEPRRFGRTKRTAVLRSVGGAGRLAGSLANVMRHYERATQHTYSDATVGVPMADLARAIAKDGGVSGWVKRVVLPELQLHALYEQQQRRTLGFFTRTRWERTPAGEQVRAELIRRTEYAVRDFRGWVDTDPARALAFVGVAGSSLLLMDSLHPDLRRLREQSLVGNTRMYVSAGSDDSDERNEGT
ncbi:MAG: hypothetical protein M3506_01955, partial [Chloroflexota bacterium]|nr:hypothetical protein [Chloroflexota bacterium]